MNATGELRTLFKAAPVWFWSAVALGAAIRLYLVIRTPGTYDVPIWERHARDVIERGVIGQYHVDPTANHPPFMNACAAGLLRAADATRIPFRIFLRAPFAMLDAGSALLLLLLFAGNAPRYVLVACYWLNPLGIILSAYHGNTDSAIAFFLLYALLLLSKDRQFAAAIAIGLSLWIKLPGIVAIPAFVFAIPKWRQRFIFAAVVGLVAISAYIPALIQDVPIVWHNVFGYRAHTVQTTTGVPTWGPRVLLFSIVASANEWPEATHAPINFLLEHGWQLAFALVVLVSWLRRDCLPRRSCAEAGRSSTALGATVAMSYVIIYAFSDGWSFQYFAWSLPFWFFLPVWFVVPAAGLTSTYIYSLYVYLCSSLWLLGEWDFVGHPEWPAAINWLRNLAVLFFVGSALFFIAATITSRVRAYRARP